MVFNRGHYQYLLDDYIGREMRMSFGLAAIIWIPHYAYINSFIYSTLFPSYGVLLNRKIEENYAHKIYAYEYGPRRNRLTHSMVFEEFEMVLENWEQFNDEFK